MRWRHSTRASARCKPCNVIALHLPEAPGPVCWSQGPVGAAPCQQLQRLPLAVQAITDYQAATMEDWCATVAEVSEQKLKLPLLTCVLHPCISRILTLCTSLLHIIRTCCHDCFT